MAMAHGEGRGGKHVLAASQQPLNPKAEVAVEAWRVGGGADRAGLGRSEARAQTRKGEREGGNENKR